MKDLAQDEQLQEYAQTMTNYNNNVVIPMDTFPKGDQRLSEALSNKNFEI